MPIHLNLTCSLANLAQEVELPATVRQQLGYMLFNEHLPLSLSDSRGRMCYVNQAFCHLSGYRRDELLGRSYRILRSGLHSPDVFRTLWETLSAGASWHGQLANRSKNGQLFHLQLHIFPFFDSEGEIGYAAIGSDITSLIRQRQSAVQAQLRSAKLLDQIIEDGPVPTFVLDLSHTITHWNRACEYITGFSAKEMVGTQKQWQPFYPQPRLVLADLIIEGLPLDESNGLYIKGRRYSSLIEGAYEAEGFFRHLGPAGRWLFLTAAPLFDTDGYLIGAIETLQDVTERKQAEQALTRAHSELEYLVEQRTKQLSVAKSELEKDIVRRKASENELRRRNEELTKLNGLLREAQQQLLQSEKMASIGQLAAGVAHEINNPVGYIQSNLASLGRYLEDLFAIIDSLEQCLSALPLDHPVAETARAVCTDKDLVYLRADLPDLLRESNEGVIRVRKIVQDLKDFSRIDRAQSWEKVDLHQGLNSTLNIAHNEIKYRADVIRHYGDIPLVECVPSQLNQVFMNLLVNAAHSMDGNKRGQITVTTRLFDPQHVAIEIQDSGCGIPKELQTRIFDPFFTTKPVGQGTGLGLSLSFGIIQNHHGRIELESEAGIGSLFRIILPVNQAMIEEPPHV